jgi:hypothetical protein
LSALGALRMTKKSDEELCDHEVRIRMIEEMNKNIDRRFDKLDESFRSVKKVLINIVIWTLVSVIIPVALHYMKLD